jgi:hypothetical protein
VIISGQLGDDAKPYQIRDARRAIAMVRRKQREGLNAQGQ